MLILVVFPAPFGPSIPKHSPRGIASDNPFTAVFGGFPSLPGYIFFISSQTIEWDETEADKISLTRFVCRISDTHKFQQTLTS